MAPPQAAGRTLNGGGDLGLGPASETWRLDREAYLLLGAGPRALLMQLAHPLIAEGVAAHSRFREDPWARLRGTLRSYLGVVFGAPAAVDLEFARLRRLHARVSGPVVDPVARAVTGASAYDARDPELMLWVHATLVDSTLETYRRWGEPLGPVDAERFYAETLALGRRFGIPEDLLPPDLRAFEAYLGRMLGPDGPVRVTPTARELAGSILRPPLGPLAPRFGRALRLVPAWTYAWALRPSLDLLPDPIRAGYGFDAGDSALRRRLARAANAWIVAVWRLGRRLLPTTLRWMPQARRADARVGLGAR